MPKINILENPIIIIIPCHRVISKNGNMRGFAYDSNTKQKLLNIENYSYDTKIPPIVP